MLVQSKEKVSYKEESEDEDYEDTKPKSKQKPKKVTPKSAPAGQTTATKKKSPIVKKETKEKKDAKTVLVKREKKVYENPGQTRETPDEVSLSFFISRQYNFVTQADCLDDEEKDRLVSCM